MVRVGKCLANRKVLRSVRIHKMDGWVFVVEGREGEGREGWMLLRVEA